MPGVEAEVTLLVLGVVGVVVAAEPEADREVRVESRTERLRQEGACLPEWVRGFMVSEGPCGAVKTGTAFSDLLSCTAWRAECASGSAVCCCCDPLVEAEREGKENDAEREDGDDTCLAAWRPEYARGSMGFKAWLRRHTCGRIGE